METQNVGIPAALLLSCDESNHTRLSRIFRRKGWMLRRVRTLAELNGTAGNVPVVITDPLLPDGDWRDCLDRVRQYRHPPQLIVTALHANDALWAEVLNRGGYDLLLKPVEPEEAERVVESAIRHWESP